MSFIEVHHLIFEIGRSGFFLSFYDYMISHHAGKQGKRSHLADDMVDDETFPREVTCQQPDGRKVIMAYLDSCGACDDCVEVFKLCWTEYRRCERRALNRNS